MGSGQAIGGRRRLLICAVTRPCALPALHTHTHTRCVCVCVVECGRLERQSLPVRRGGKTIARAVCVGGLVFALISRSPVVFFGEIDGLCHGHGHETAT